MECQEKLKPKKVKINHNLKLVDKSFKREPKESKNEKIKAYTFGLFVGKSILPPKGLGNLPQIG